MPAVRPFPNLPEKLVYGLRTVKNGHLLHIEPFCEPPCEQMLLALGHIAALFPHAASSNGEVRCELSLSGTLVVHSAPLPDEMQALLAALGLSAVDHLQCTIDWLHFYELPGHVERYLLELQLLDVPLTSAMLAVGRVEAPIFWDEQREGILEIRPGSKLDRNSDDPRLVLYAMPERDPFPFARWANDQLIGFAQQLIGEQLARQGVPEGVLVLAMPSVATA